MPFTTLCVTFFAVIAVLFATFLAVRTGPASTLLTATAKPSMMIGSCLEPIVRENMHSRFFSG